jgi:hypothetical protein
METSATVAWSFFDKKNHKRNRPNTKVSQMIKSQQEKGLPKQLQAYNFKKT